MSIESNLSSLQFLLNAYGEEPLALTTAQTKLQVVSCDVTNDVTTSVVHIGNLAWFTTNSVAFVSYIVTAIIIFVNLGWTRVCTVEI